MRILLINHYAGSPHHGMEFRPYYLAREWVRAGHAVCIVAASASHLRQQAPVMNGQALQQEWIDGIDYRWIATPRYRGNGLGRMANLARAGALDPLDAVAVRARAHLVGVAGESRVERR